MLSVQGAGSIKPCPSSGSSSSRGSDSGLKPWNKPRISGRQKRRQERLLDNDSSRSEDGREEEEKDCSGINHNPPPDNTGAEDDSEGYWEDDSGRVHGADGTFCAAQEEGAEGEDGAPGSADCTKEHRLDMIQEEVVFRSEPVHGTGVFGSAVVSGCSSSQGRPNTGPTDNGSAHPGSGAALCTQGVLGLTQGRRAVAKRK